MFKLLLKSSLGVLPKSPLFTLLFLSFINLLTPTCLFQPNPHESFWETFGAQVFWIVHMPPLMRQQVSFPIFCRPFLVWGSTSYLRSSLNQWPIWGAGHLLYLSYCKIPIKSLPIIIKGNRCQQFWSIPLPSPFEDGVRAPSLGRSGMHSSFHVVYWKGIK